MCIKKIFNGNDSFCIQSISRVNMASNPCLKYAPSWGGGRKMMSIHMIDNLSK